MKTLYLIGGPMGVGKTAAGQALKLLLDNSVFLDGDWCWDMHPFRVTEETKELVLGNIALLLNRFLRCSACDHVILAWVLHRQEVLDALLEQVDNGVLKVTPAADCISHLSEKEQTALLVIMERDEVSPSLGQAKRLKELSEEGKLDANVMEVLLREDKSLARKVTLKNDRLQKYFPPSYTPKQMEEVIIRLLDQWQRKKMREQER